MKQEVIVLLLFYIISVSCLYDDFCTVNTESCGPIPPTMPKNFVTKIQQNSGIDKETIYLEEYYHGSQLNGHVRVFWKNLEVRVYYNYYVDSMVILIGGVSDPDSWVCDTGKIEDYFMTPISGWNLSSIYYHIPSPATALHFGGDLKYTFVNHSNVRGIPSHNFNACNHWVEQNGTFSFDYSWTDPLLWTSLDKYEDSIPVQLHMRGKKSPVGVEGNDSTEVNTWFEYSEFDRNPDWKLLTSPKYNTVFEIPSGVFCNGLKNLKPMPKDVPNYFSIRSENIIQFRGVENIQVHTLTNWYDTKLMLARMDGIPLATMAEYQLFGDRELSIVQDFHSGVEYVTDRTLGNCTAMPIPISDTDVTVYQDGTVTIKDPFHFFAMDSANFTYHGKKFARGMLCDVWAALKTVNILGIEDSMVYEWYFLADDWIYETETSVEMNQFVPIQLRVKQNIGTKDSPLRNKNSAVDSDVNQSQYGLASQKLKIDVSANYFQFSNTEPDLDIYDITSCFEKGKVKHLQMSFSGSYREYYLRTPKIFLSGVHSALAIEAQVSPLRVQHVQVEFDEQTGRLFTEFDLLGKPSIQGDAPSTVSKALSLEEAINKLTDAMDAFIIPLDIPGMPEVIEIYAEPDSLMEDFVPNCVQYKPSSEMTDVRKSLADREPESSAIDSGLWYEDVNSTKDGTVITFNSTSTIDSVFSLLSLWENLHSGEDVMRGLHKKSEGLPYTSGDMTGMAVGMLLTGIILGVGIMICVLSKYHRNSNEEQIQLTPRI